MDKQGYKSIKRAQKLIDRQRDDIEAGRLKRLGFMDGSVEPGERGVEGARAGRRI